MRRRIDQLLNGIFEYEMHPPVLSQERISTEVTVGTVLTDTFSVTSATDRKVKGFLYSSNPRVTFDPPQFYAAECRIQYQVDTNGLAGGDVTEGYFTLCTDAGELTLPYTFSIRKEREGSVSDEAGSAGELAEIARHDAQKARRIFTGEPFARALRAKQPGEYQIYEPLKGGRSSARSMEEFLIGCGQKDPVELSLEDSALLLKRPARSQKYSAVLLMNGWGYLEIEISSDVRFLRLEKKQVTTDDFVGGRLPVEYIVDTNFLHPGKNYGRIRIRSAYQTLYLEVTVQQGEESAAAHAIHIQKLMRRKMLSLYIDLRLKKMDMQPWIDRSLNVLSSYKRAGGTDVFADLFLVQLYFADGKRIKAKRLLQEIENKPERFATQEQYAFYLYMTTFFERDAAYVDQVEARIEQMFLGRRESWILQWILLYLQERYLKDESAKLEAIEAQIQYGCSSPIMYLEAAQIVRKDPWMLKGLSSFEIRLLLFMARHGMLTEELGFRISNLALQNLVFDKKVFSILCACYEQTPSREVLRAICSMLIAGDCKDPEYFSWYALGVNDDLHITGLYEYYMETMDTVGIEKMPQIIRMYFSYDNTLNYHKKAGIYRNISDNRDSVPQVFRSARPGIDHFVTEQLSLGRIDADLAVLYERFITRRLLTPALAEKLVRLLFTFEVTCKNPGMQSVAVSHPNMKRIQEVPLNDGKARIQIYSPDARIFLVDQDGNRYASTSLYMAERFLDSPLLVSYCRELVPEHPGLVLYMCARSEEITAETLPYFQKAVQLDTLREDWKKEIRRRILEFYRQNPRRDDLYDYLNSISYADFIEAGKSNLLLLLTNEGMYEQAFRLLETYGVEGVDAACLVRICSQTVLLREYEENTVLLADCFQCYQYGKYDDNILTYLLMYYDGPIEEMKRLWTTGHANELDTMLLEEKILTLLLFTRTGSAGTEQIFASYQHKLGRRKICRAYMILKSYEYLVKNLPVNDLIFGYLEQLQRDGADLEDVCSLALLQYYSGMSVLSDERREMVGKMLADYNSRGIRLAFFQRFPADLISDCQLEDRVFVEYVANPENQVMLCYRMRGVDETYEKEPMKNCFEGIFVKEFILFEGEEIDCYMEEMRDGEVTAVSAHRILRSGGIPEDSTSRYAMLCRMSREAGEGNMKQLEADLDNYYQLDYLTKEIFTLLG